MKKLIISLLLLSSFTSNSQEVKTWHECYDQHFKIVASLEGGIRNKYLSTSAKIGAWQNDSENGFTLFVGNTQVFQERKVKLEMSAYEYKTFYFFEAGYKVRLYGTVISQIIFGYGQNKYAGGYIYYECTNQILLFGFLKDKTVGFGMSIALN